MSVRSMLLLSLFSQVALGQQPPVTKEDLPRIPATHSSKALQTFQTAAGFRLELVAAEPLVADPVDACFDENGRMYVAEMHGYPFSQESTRLNPKGGGKKDAGVIRLLEDTNGDGRMDKSTVFARGISWPVSVCCSNGGVFVLAPKHLYFFKDTNGDGKADVKRIVLSGFGRGNVQAMANNLKWGLDNHIYFAAGRNSSTITHQGKPLFRVGRADIRFDPRTEKFELITGGSQFGLSFDNWGNRFVCSNSNHIQHVVFPRRYLARNPQFAAPGGVRGIAAAGAASRVYRISPPEPWRIIRQKWRARAKGYKLVFGKDGSWRFEPLDPTKKKGAVPTEYPVGYFTSASAVTIYRGSAYPREFRGNAFVGDVGGNLVHRKTLKPHGVSFIAHRADKGTEIMRSRDNWFRPVNLVNAPDGSLYVLDMYRETVEHPHSIPPEIKKHLFLESGDDRGRIYRLVSPKMQRIRVPRLGKLSSARLVSHLESENAWHRETAQRLLVERNVKDVTDAVTKTATASKNPLGRIHALYTLVGLQSMNAAVLRKALADHHPRVREHAIRLSDPFLKSDESLVKLIAKLGADDDPRVRFQVAFSLGESKSQVALDALADMAVDPRNNRDIRVAILSSLAGRADRLAMLLLNEESSNKSKTAAEWILELSRLTAAAKNTAPARKLLLASLSSSARLRNAALQGLSEGLRRRGGNLSKLTIGDAAATKKAREFFNEAKDAATDAKQAADIRISSVKLLAFAESEMAVPALRSLLKPATPPAVQIAAVEALAEHDSDAVAKSLLAPWRVLSPQVRKSVLAAMTSRERFAARLLDAIDKKSIAAGEIPAATRRALRGFPSATIRTRAARLFGRIVSNRKEIVARFRSVLDLKADVQKGQTVFASKCAICHRVGKRGHAVGPDAKSFINKSPDDLLTAILDPNRELQPNFQQYNVLTNRGQAFNGIIAAESAASVTLRKAEGKQATIFRNEIRRMASTGKSLMPDDLENALSRQDVADVIAYLKSLAKKKR